MNKKIIGLFSDSLEAVVVTWVWVRFPPWHFLILSSEEEGVLGVLGLRRLYAVVLRRQAVAELVDVGVVLRRLDVERPEARVVGYGTESMAAGEKAFLLEGHPALRNG